MSPGRLEIVGSGMVTAVGLNAPSTCAAIRCGINNFQETRFVDSDRERITGSEVPLGTPLRGTTKLAQMLAMAIEECFRSVAGCSPSELPILIGLAEETRPGRNAGLVGEVFFKVQQILGRQFHPDSKVLSLGRVFGIVALRNARTMIHELGFPQVVIAGVDSLLSAETLNGFEKQARLLTSTNSNGFVPGEAAAAILVAAESQSKESKLVCTGIGGALESAHVLSGKPLRADGLSKAIQAALEESGCDLVSVDYRICDVSGEQYGFKEASLAITRILRAHKDEFEILHVADCVGEVGAAAGPLALGFIKCASENGFAPGDRALFHASSDDGKRVAAILEYGVQAAS